MVRDKKKNMVESVTKNPGFVWLALIMMIVEYTHITMRSSGLMIALCQLMIELQMNLPEIRQIYFNLHGICNFDNDLDTDSTD